MHVPVSLSGVASCDVIARFHEVVVCPPPSVLCAVERRAGAKASSLEIDRGSRGKAATKEVWWPQELETDDQLAEIAEVR